MLPIQYSQATGGWDLHDPVIGAPRGHKPAHKKTGAARNEMHPLVLPCERTLRSTASLITALKYAVDSMAIPRATDSQTPIRNLTGRCYSI